MKERREEHFRFVHHNVSRNDDFEMEYAKFENVGLKDHCVRLSNTNVLQRAHQQACLCMRKH